MAQSCWFLETEHPKRVSTATVLSLSVSGVWLFLLATLSSAFQNPFKPFMAIQRIFYPSMTSLYIVILSLISVWAALAHSCSYSVTKSKPKSSSSIIYSMLQPQVMLTLVISTFQGLVSSVCFLRLAWPSVTEDERFLVGVGAVTGAWMGFQYCFMSASTLHFPIIHKERSYQIQEMLSLRVLTKAMFQSFRILQHYFVGSLLLNLTLYQTLPCGLSINVAVATLITTTFLHVINHTNMATFSLVLTAPLPDLSHPDLLACLSSSSPLLRILSLQSLSRTLRTDPAVRSHIFSLSQPGGHPTNWRTVSRVCMDNLNAVFPKQPKTAKSPVSSTVTTSSSTNTVIRRLGGNDSNGTKLQDLSLAEIPDPQLLNVTSALEKLKSFGSITRSERTEDLLSMINSIDVLTQLMVFSLIEDKFGVVQKDLADIISLLAKLDNEISSLKLGETSELRRAVSSGLYRTAFAFGHHLEDVPLPSNVQLKMKSYTRFLSA